MIMDTMSGNLKFKRIILVVIEIIKAIVQLKLLRKMRLCLKILEIVKFLLNK